MKDVNLRIYSLVAALLLLTLASMGARAKDSADGFLSDLHNFRVSNYMALDAYYRFSGTGATDTLNEIVKSINAANESMNSVAGSDSGVLSADEVEGLNREFEEFKNLMRDNINDVRNLGYPDLRLVSDMANQALTMNEKATELYRAAQESAQTQTNPRVEAARSAAVVMAQMMAKYSVRTNSSATQTFQGSSIETPLDEQARQLDQLLASVIQGQGTPALEAQLNDISSKWQFIRGSYINYNENNVGFVIDRYSKGILKGLTATIELMQSNA
ncbi:hypothetical protein [Marinobacter sp. F3R08]|uniref:hypothetical protein n=1 Tax=Marinobacter sp. F3R08 TaxID=2841559 RepID=UPI001C084C67|nr:hypothetical protein [Marinobacter sp. F3R08]MBU2952542.1 hypothetical protein [Marinobacter sp. F3R08]